MQALRRKGRQSDRQIEMVDDKQVQARMVGQTDRYGRGSDWEAVQHVDRETDRFGKRQAGCSQTHR